MIEMMDMVVLMNGAVSIIILRFVVPLYELKGKVDELSRTTSAMIKSIDGRVRSIEERM